MRMATVTFLFIGISALVGAAKAQTSSGSAADEAAIRAILDERNGAYNRHDARTMASVYATDVDLVTGTGRYLSGRAEIESYYTGVFNGVDKNAMVKIERTKLRFLTADVAVLDIDGVVTGRTDGTARNHATWICLKRNGKWTVVSIRATRVQ